MRGFTQFDTIYATSGYDWSVLGVFKRDADGQFFYGTDGGCSCGHPFESTYDPANLLPLHELYPFLMFARKWARDQQGWASETDLHTKINELRDKIRANSPAELAKQLDNARELLSKARQRYADKVAIAREAQESADYALANLEAAQVEFNRLLDAQHPAN